MNLLSKLFKMGGSRKTKRNSRKSRRGGAPSPSLEKALAALNSNKNLQNATLKKGGRRRRGGGMQAHQVMQSRQHH
jgi:hypothetical protein